MKKKILFINSVCGFGSTGRIVAELSKIENYETLVCFGRKNDLESVNSFKFADFFDNSFGATRTILFDNNINICNRSTEKLLNKIKEFAPDIIHLHNIHGYYVNVEKLFNFLYEYKKPVVWTFHDVWPMSGYCVNFEYWNCNQYKNECKECKCGFYYPFSIFKQKVNSEYLLKKKLFTSIDNLQIVTSSKWLKGIVESSFLKEKNSVVINNGINLDRFKPSKAKNNKFTVLALTSVWTEDKGIDDLNRIIPLLDNEIEVIVVGKNSDKVKGCKTINRIDDIDKLVDIYSSSHVLLNPTLDDNFPSVNIESLACGTPVVTYKTGGSPEIVDEKTGVVVKKGDYNAMAKVINELKENYYFYSEDCVERSKEYSKERMIDNYRKLYENLLVE